MKSLVIFGISRAGKTTLSKMIVDKYKFNLVSIDAMRSAFSKVLPEHGIHHRHNQRKPDSELILIPFVAQYAIRLSEHYLKKIPCLVEGGSCTPKMAKELFPGEDFKIIALGYPDISAQDKFKAIRENDINDWTTTLSDSDLTVRCKENIEKSKILQDECNKLGVPFLNTSFNRGIILSEFVSGLPEFLSE